MGLAAKGSHKQGQPGLSQGTLVFALDSRGCGSHSELCSQSSQCALKVLVCPEGSNVPRVSTVKVKISRDKSRRGKRMGFEKQPLEN
jgi:hypothetical protein